MVMNKKDDDSPFKTILGMLTGILIFSAYTGVCLLMLWIIMKVFGLTI